ncbi:hypothetical protein [Pelomonas sp. SE-A7]|uniref:hypothetical protein n=1 Tax=Pelomonas sp. SE-A7 TaxID=3054953 RepID=UPI00259D188F|nr:hypothetical protein [Pelomonas sp. SE-A7]MDM4767893.1 hypothetical protein [Pelomonas sp. SE-A7]
MILILALALGSCLLGALLASELLSWLPLRPGLLGLALMLSSAVLARRHWQRSPQGPGSVERACWHGLASYSLLAGHLGGLLWRLGPQLDMHSLRGHALAVDSWTLILGALLSWQIARDPQPLRDERDRLFQAAALRTAWHALTALLVMLILALGFGERTPVAGFNQPLIAHLLILLLTLACVVHEAAQLRLYGLEARLEAQREAEA